jgi:hypothetical protein
MAQADWTQLSLGLTSGALKQGVTNGAVARPNGGGNFVYGFNSVAVTPGSAGLFVNLTNFAPMAKGCSIRGCIQRGVSGGPTNFAPYFFVSLTGTTVGDRCYMLGLMDEDPHHIAFVKGVLANGIPSASIGASGVWSKSTATYAAGTWLQLRMDVIVEPNNDVLIQFFQSDLGAHVCTAPSWGAITGMPNFLDDHLDVATGTDPLTSGYGGFGFTTKDVTRRGYFDQIEVWRQQ